MYTFIYRFEFANSFIFIITFDSQDKTVIHELLLLSYLNSRTYLPQQETLKNENSTQICTLLPYRLNFLTLKNLIKLLTPD